MRAESPGYMAALKGHERATSSPSEMCILSPRVVPVSSWVRSVTSALSNSCVLSAPRPQTVGAPVGKIDFLLSKNCVFYRIAIERGAQYKVYGTLFNILSDKFYSYGTHVQLAVTVSRSIFARRREASEASRSTALLTTSTPLLLPHMYVRSSPRT